MGFAKEIQMGERAALRRPIVAFVVLVGMAIAAPPAAANTEEIIAPSTPPYTVTSGWQAGTCTKDVPDTAEQCSVATPGQFFELAGGHPQVGFTQFIVASKAPGETPVGEVQKIHVDLPQGLSVNPQATKQCPLATFQAGASGCESGFPESKVGESLVTVSVLGVPFAPTGGVTQVPVYNVEPETGQPALFGLELAGKEVFLKASVDWAGDYHEGFTIDIPQLPFSGLLTGGVVLKNRLPFNGRAGDGTFITTPTTCFDPETEPAHKHIYSTYLLAASAQEMEKAGYTFPASAEPPLESPLPEGKKPIKCNEVPYKPTTGLEPNTAETDSPSGATTNVEVPFITGGEERESSQTKQAKLTLPVGMGLNGSAATGLLACTDEQFGKGTENPVACPPQSKIGTVSIETPPLPEPITGSVFVGQQLSRDPSSGNEYRIFVDGESPKFGLSVRLVGRVSADPATGRLTTTFGELPQVPFSSFTIQLNGGPKATLTSPFVCGPHRSTATMSPWTGEADATPTSEFTLTSAPGGKPGSCPKTLAERPFAPKFEAHGTNPQAGAFTDVNIDVVREPGSQELKGADVKLPPGLTAKLAGVRYCPEEAIAAAAANSGTAEAASPSCPPESLIGSASITSGSGPEPLHIEGGKAFLAGPYHGAPLSLAVITPATAGPFDLGTVVVRVALLLDPKTAQVTAVTDPIPHIYGGALLDIRSVSVKVDRPQFALNPTNCSPFAFDGTLRGGGANPADPAGFTSIAVSSPFQVSGCEGLGFKPKLYLRAFGGTKRTKKPKLRAILIPRPGDANISRGVVTLPKAFILEQANIGNVCTRVQFAANECPANSVYGFAEATTPLLDGPLKGPVYLRSNPEHELPDLVAALHGQVDVELTGVTDTTKQGRLRNTFEMVPDVPVSKFILTVRGGKQGLLVNTRNLCGHKLYSRVELNGQNGAHLLEKRLPVRTSCKKKKHHHHHHRGH
jgi:hypothetical protein